MPNIYMIAGPNGAGKTTSAMNLLPDILRCEEYVNADSIAEGLSPFKQEEVAFKAGRLMLEQIHQLADENKDFAFETTGASRTFVRFLSKCKQKGYITYLLYLWLKSPELAVERVAARVEHGGHDIPEGVVRRRYRQGVMNVFRLYMPIMAGWLLYDNSGNQPKLVAKKWQKSAIIINNQEIWQTLQNEVMNDSAN